ncbi:molybdopterin-dependent oxidoreductase [Pinirhizobacter sp.]|jgi:DMSO/TMAO reductase YedYZ molybdopterin-dependent catalytic subunit|uniref:molybdopterin-dependent oxidoreductase n=1 Tax=Pinirhizobacter sp. TaxID=2950432 RepID=UPI002F415064
MDRFAPSRRHFMGLLGITAAAAVSGLRAADVQLPFDNGKRQLVEGFEGKGRMILQRTRAPLLETPFEVYDNGLLTPVDRFYVRWHTASAPRQIDTAAFRLNVHGHVERELSLALADLRSLPAREVTAVSQCAGNSRGFSDPRVPGAQWGNGAMGNAVWRGVNLRQVLDRAGVKAGSMAIRFRGLDAAPPHFGKSLGVDIARNDDVLLATHMNGQPLPWDHGFPLRLVVPGWFATYWVKAVSDIEVLTTEDDNYWMAKAYRIPATPDGSTTPGAPAGATTPISTMPPRSFVTNVRDGDRLRAHSQHAIRGIAFSGKAAIRRVEWSGDGNTWHRCQIDGEGGVYGFRRWHTQIPVGAPGGQQLLVRATDAAGNVQPLHAGWNPGGFMRNAVESLNLVIA